MEVIGPDGQPVREATLYEVREVPVRNRASNWEVKKFDLKKTTGIPSSKSGRHAFFVIDSPGCAFGILQHLLSQSGRVDHDRPGVRIGEANKPRCMPSGLFFCSPKSLGQPMAQQICCTPKGCHTTALCNYAMLGSNPFSMEGQVLEEAAEIQYVH